jgi:hypothetical protein
MAERQTQPPQKRPGQLVWVQIPLSPPRERLILSGVLIFRQRIEAVSAITDA